jgi:hypothetical protein
MEQDRLSDGVRLDAAEPVSLCEVLDRVLHKGVALRVDIVLSVAGVDLVYLGLQLLLSSTETARRAGVVVPGPVSSLLGPNGGMR